jgi:hypothetical protein
LNVFEYRDFEEDVKVSGGNAVEKAKVISAVREYEKKKTRRKERKVDFTVSRSESDDKILIRAITESESKSGYIGVDAVREMIDFLERNRYDKGILIGEKFTVAARGEMKRANIEEVSESVSPSFKLDRLHSTVGKYVEKLCRVKCGHVPTKEGDCKGYVNGHYSCDIRLASDNADFYYEKGWEAFLERDLMKLLAIEKALKS